MYRHNQSGKHLVFRRSFKLGEHRIDGDLIFPYKIKELANKEKIVLVVIFCDYYGTIKFVVVFVGYRLYCVASVLL